MSIKLKTLSLSLLIAFALGGAVVINASAESQEKGHFTFGSPHTTLEVTESGEHRLELKVKGITPIVCDEPSYSSTVEGTTATEISVAPELAACKTTEGEAGEVEVATNGCYYLLKPPNKKAATAENTVDLVCPTEPLKITHTGESCVISIPGQSGLSGVGYGTIEIEESHALTVTASVTGITAHFEGGFCILLGTKQEAELTGSVTVRAIGIPYVGITATGSED